MSGWASLSRLKQSVSDGVQQAAHSVSVGAKEAALSVTEGAKEAAGQVNHGVAAAQQQLSKVRVFELDALQQQQQQHEAGSAMGAKAAQQQTRKGPRQAHYPELDLTYVTDRLIVMGFPAGKARGGAVAPFLNDRHGGDYMVWNLSEKAYDCGAFDGQVLDFRFPGYPSPPIGVLFNLVMSMESWLKSAASNVVVVHCMTGRGRSITVAACLLEWAGLAADASEALRFACAARRVPLAAALVPSQLRYATMFHDIMDGIRPRLAPLTLKRVTLRSLPDMYSDADRARDDLPQTGGGGCRPYVQVFKGGKLLFTSAWADSQREGGTPAFGVADAEPDGVTLDVDCFVDGDVLLRVRHVDTASGKGVSMFRYGFHTGYAPLGTTTLKKADLDGASVDPRFPEDFAVEVEFATAKAHAQGGADEGPGQGQGQGESQGQEGGQSKSEGQGHVGAVGLFDESVSSKATFWNQIAAKKDIAKRRTQEEVESLLRAPVRDVDGDGHGDGDGVGGGAAPAAGGGAGAGTGAGAGAGAGAAAAGAVAFDILGELDDDDDDDDDDRLAREDRIGSHDSASELMAALGKEVAAAEAKPASSAKVEQEEEEEEEEREDMEEEEEEEEEEQEGEGREEADDSQEEEESEGHADDAAAGPVLELKESSEEEVQRAADGRRDAGERKGTEALSALEELAALEENMDDLDLILASPAPGSPTNPPAAVTAAATATADGDGDGDGDEDPDLAELEQYLSGL